MSSAQWIRIVTNIFDDEKIRIIEKMPQGDTILVIWLKLLCFAGKSNDGGLFYVTRDIPYKPETLAVVVDRDIMIVKLAVKTFLEFGMIDILDEHMAIANWEKHQNVEGLERIREQSRERMRKFRERKKLKQLEFDGDATCDVTVTDGDAPDKNRIEKNREDNKLIVGVYTPEFEEIWKIYPKKSDNKKAGHRKYVQHINSGITHDTLLLAAKNYAAEMVKEGRDNKYIKQFSTFFGPDEHWKMFLDEMKQEKGAQDWAENVGV